MIYVYVPVEYLNMQDSIIGIAMTPNIDISQWLDVHKDKCYFDSYRLCVVFTDKDLAIEFRLRWL